MFRTCLLIIFYLLRTTKFEGETPSIFELITGTKRFSFSRSL